MKLTHTTVATIAAVACIALYGCGNSTDSTNVSPTLDSTPPPAPESIVLITGPTENRLTWAASPAADVVKYEVYQYMPDPTRDNAYVMIGESATSSFKLLSQDEMNTYFRVRTVDQSGNRSGLSVEYRAHVPPVIKGNDGDPTPTGEPDNNPVGGGTGAPDGSPGHRIGE